jgi:CDP-paratose 2-epimerase
MNQFKRIVITGGAGFVGSSLALRLKEYFVEGEVVAFDNLRRHGSELNLPRLEKGGVSFIKGDVCNIEDIEMLGAFDMLIDAAAECSVKAGLNGSPSEVVNTNIVGTFNALEAARKNDAAFLFISTSRVYPIAPINNLPFYETENRFEWSVYKGIAEDFSLAGARSIYGATKLAGELLVQEYGFNYRMKTLINRCGIIAGPWQMAKADQGVITLWTARHIYDLPLKYIGFGGEGKQVRDVLYIDDFTSLVCRQIEQFELWDCTIYNVGGGIDSSTSLCELTGICRDVTGKTLHVSSESGTSPVDMRIYLSETRKVQEEFNWQPEFGVCQTVTDIAQWINDNHNRLKRIFI